MDLIWIGYTIGAISHLWMIKNIFELCSAHRTARLRRFTRGQGKVTIYNRFYYPFMIGIGFWMWMFFG